jgi:hypothetical protein
LKADIEIPEVKNVHVVAISQWNDDFLENSWYAYLINDTNQKLEMAMVVATAFGEINGEERKSATLRHAFSEVLPYTSVRIELLENNILQLNNTFSLSYFLSGKLYDKQFTFVANSIAKENITELPLLTDLGIIAH